MSALPDYLTPLDHGIFAVDTGFHRPRFDAAFLVVDNGRAAFIDTGTALAVPRLLQALQAVGLRPDQVDWVIPTHVHLDHAGGVGLLMQSLPCAKVLVHPRGARHLADPRALWAGALAVYGQEEMDRSYGALVPVPDDRLQCSTDGGCITLGQRLLELMDAPGHARHHHVVWEPLSQAWFTGDSFGLSYRELDTQGVPWILPTTTPIRFEPDALRQTFLKMLARKPERVFLTHFGALGDVPALGRQLLDLLDQVVALGRSLADAPDRHAALKSGLRTIYLASLRAAGNRLSDDRIDELLAMDIELNAQGMGCWLDRPASH